MIILPTVVGFYEDHVLARISKKKLSGWQMRFPHLFYGAVTESTTVVAQ